MTEGRKGQLPEPCTCDMQNICPEHGALGYERERMAFLEHMVDSAHDVLWSVAGQLAGFTEEYRDPDGNDCKVAVAHVIAQDIEKFMESGAAHAK